MRQLRESLEIYLHSFMVAMAALAWASELYLIEKRFSPNRGLPSQRLPYPRRVAASLAGLNFVAMITAQCAVID
jgi:hypothetical protein